jgi:glycosyltransferase involved in cell wall biosynthesis
MDKKLKIVLLVPTLRLGGLQSLVYTLCEEMNRQLHEAIIYNIGLSSDITYYDNKYIDIVSGERPNKSGMITEILTFHKFIKFVQKFKPDIIQSHTGISDLYLALIRNSSRFIKIRCQITPQSFATRPVLGHILENYVLKFRYHHFITVNNKIRNKLIDQKINHEKITFINNPIPTWIINRKIDDFTSKDDRIIISFLGRLSHEKGADRVIKLFFQLLPFFDEKINLIIGGQGVLFEELNSYVGDLNLQKTVKIIGYVDDLHAFYNKSDIVINTSRFEGVPITLLEAASYGCSIISTKTEASDELDKLIPNLLIIENSDEILIKDIQIMADWIRSQVKKTRKINLYPNAMKCLSPSIVAKEYLKVYNKLIN